MSTDEIKVNDARLNKGREYYQSNKEKINKATSNWKKEKVKCDCGLELSRGSLCEHKKTERHRMLLIAEQV